MLLRFLMIALLAVSMTACSSTEDEASTDPSLMGGSGMSQGPLEGTEVYDGNQMGGGTAVGAPGSQEDLATNVGDRVFFGYDRYDLAPEAQATLDKQAQWLSQYASVNATIEGHSDERGTREYNIALGERRANAVKSYLVSKGVSPQRLNTISYGKEQPAVIGANPGSWAQNRRGVTRVE
jgi:peptidoglycan-associated lipoprotein